MPTGGSVNVAGSVVPFSDRTKLLGSILDGNIRVVLDATRTTAESRVGSRLYYAKFIIYSASRKKIARMQRIQNVLARVVTCTRVTDHITPTLQSLHWLYVEYKLAVVTFKARTGTAPQYLCSLVNNYEPSRNSAPQTCNYSRFCALSPYSLLTASALPLH
mgnify:FL=1